MKPAFALRRQEGPLALLRLREERIRNVGRAGARSGHTEGDHALREVAELLVDSFRDSDVVARLGGNEFCVLLTGTSEKELERPLERLEAAFSVRNAEPDRPYRLAYSVGVVRYDPARHASVEDLMADADRLMYERKRSRQSTAPR